MGLSVQYSGTIKVCTVFYWNYRLVTDETLTGISFTPPECETVWLTFLRDGQQASGPANVDD